MYSRFLDMLLLSKKRGKAGVLQESWILDLGPWWTENSSIFSPWFFIIFIISDQLSELICITLIFFWRSYYWFFFVMQTIRCFWKLILLKIWSTSSYAWSSLCFSVLPFSFNLCLLHRVGTNSKCLLILLLIFPAFSPLF